MVRPRARRQPGRARALAAAGPPGEPGRRGDDHPLAPRSRTAQLRGSLNDLTGNLDRLRSQLRDIELQAESQMQSRMAQAKDTAAGFDPLEFDRFTRVQELTRMMAESVNDVATVQRNIQRVVEATEDDLIAQARQTRELQRDLLRTRMVEFEGISDRLYRVVRLAAKESAKQVKLDITGGSIEMDRGVLDRMTPPSSTCCATAWRTASKRPTCARPPARTPPAPSSSSCARKATTSRWNSRTTAPASTWPASARRRCSRA
jgi:hypothetical protein